MTNQDTLDYLSQYPSTDVETALGQLGYDINSPEFPETIIEEVEAILDSIGEAVVRQKQLSKSFESQEPATESQSESLMIRETAEIAAEILDVRNVHVDQKVLFAIAQSVISQTKTQAAAINQLRRETFVAELRRGQQELTDDVLQVMSQGQKSTDALFSSENLRKMVDRAAPQHQPRFDVDQFLDEVKLSVTEAVNKGNEVVRVGKESHSAKVDFDLDGFLNEVWD